MGDANSAANLQGMTDTAAGKTDEILMVTDGARATVFDIRSREDDAEGLGLRVEVTGASGVDYTYDLSLEPVADAAEDDWLYSHDGLTVIIPANSVDAMRGATLDLPSVAGQGGLVIRNPNRPNPLGDLGQLELTGDAANKVRVLLAERINPALAAHGGFAELVGVEGSTAYVTMGGGCQGCSMSAATLQEGIQRAILEAIPEVTEVIDATDHQQGENPYYT
jgi:Fe/S biogenesis protein NfuA